MTENPTVATVAATLRMAADYARVSPDSLVTLADEIERDWNDTCCPICEHEVCDATCPLKDVRGRKPHERSNQ